MEITPSKNDDENVYEKYVAHFEALVRAGLALKVTTPANEDKKVAPNAS